MKTFIITIEEIISSEDKKDKYTEKIPIYSQRFETALDYPLELIIKAVNQL